jgi:2-haloacid dehalogenase
MAMTTTSARPAACVFDAYGTLFDFAGAVERRADIVGHMAGSLTKLWREKQLQYTWLRTVQGKYIDFERVTADALDYALEALGIGTAGVRDELLHLYATLPVFPDASRALKQLKVAGIRSLILSNGTRAMLASALRASGIESLIDGVLSVESVGAFKPDPRVYHLAVEELGVAANQLVFVSANGWDACAAAAFGFRTVWCNRSGQPHERLADMPDREVRCLDELAL